MREEGTERMRRKAAERRIGREAQSETAIDSKRMINICHFLCGTKKKRNERRRKLTGERGERKEKKRRKGRNM